MQLRAAFIVCAIAAMLLAPHEAQALPRQSCAKLMSWVTTDPALHSGGWSTEPVYRAKISGTSLHNAEYVAWVDDPCFVSHEDIVVAEQSAKGSGAPDPNSGYHAASQMLDHIYGARVASDFTTAASTRLPNELVLLGKQFSYVLHWVDESGVPGEWPAYTEWVEIWPRDAQLPDH